MSALCTTSSHSMLVRSRTIGRAPSAREGGVAALAHAYNSSSSMLVRSNIIWGTGGTSSKERSGCSRLTCLQQQQHAGQEQDQWRAPAVH
jgi:hypothetical protein